MHGLYWFRSDLRITDNFALAKAIRESDVLFSIFIFTPKTWKKQAIAPCKIQFLLDNLQVLSKALWKQGIPLRIKSVPQLSDCPTILKKLCQRYHIDNLYFNREYTLDERNRDKAVQHQLQDKLKIQIFDERLVLPPGAVLSKQGTPLQIFTPFKNTWLKEAHEQKAWAIHRRSHKKFKSPVLPTSVPNTLPSFTSHLENVIWLPGEQAAQRHLKKFCRNPLKYYKRDRDYPYLTGTSQLSPYLTQGVLSPRQCITEALHTVNISNLTDLNKKIGVSTWINELIWREFYHHIIYFFPDVCQHKPFRTRTDKIPWQYDDQLIHAWQAGQTGFPLVDAGMRQLNQTGWMHNRLRMVVAMFFSKILLLDWRRGEKYFMQHLIDGDFAANNGGWQWCASTGTDASPYFRIFNPITQSQRFDKNGDFIKKFCPELSHLDNKTIHNPYKYGITPNQLNYPQPIVDYQTRRKRVIKLFKNL